ncbi:hypothetical protein F2P81_005688 [Scophthalmus maximus]|uniref:Uncharacterized protein n=1 Tax=Scophthalmus maximus TaxID=52904 RepID=A0A6A4T3S8_SCOMX|nr:hypothetical protein F2P81_005688 [Scophthalmus maximus]
MASESSDSNMDREMILADFQVRFVSGGDSPVRRSGLSPRRCQQQHEVTAVVNVNSGTNPDPENQLLAPFSYIDDSQLRQLQSADQLFIQHVSMY